MLQEDISKLSNNRILVLYLKLKVQNSNKKLEIDLNSEIEDEMISRIIDIEEITISIVKKLANW